MQPLLIGGAIGVILGMTGELLPWVFVLFFVAVVRYGLTAPRTLGVSVVAGVFVLPDFMGWYLPGLGLLNLPRIVNYAAAGVIAGLIVGDRRGTLSSRLRVSVPTIPNSNSKWLHYSLLALGFSWAFVVATGVGQGFSTGIRALNSIVYQIVPLWIGMRLISDENGIELVAVSLAAALILLFPLWLYEVVAKTSVFANYVPPVGGGLADSRIPLMRGGYIRAEASFGHPLNFGQFLLIAIPLACALMFRVRWRLLGFAATVAGIGGLIASRSRSPWIALLAGVALWAGLRWPRTSMGVVTLIVSALIAITPLRDRIWNAVVVSPYRTSSPDRGLTFSEGTEQRFSAIARVFVVQASIGAIARKPLTGYGIGRIIDVARIPTVDNYPLRLALESGIPASLLFLIGVSGLLLYICRQRSPDLHVSVVLALVEIGLIAYVLEWTLVGQRQTLPVFLLVLGMAIAFVQRSDSKPIVQHA